MKSSPNPFLRALLAGVFLSGIPLSASAQIYWDGTLSGTSALWSTVSGWSTNPGDDFPDPDAVPGASDLAVFSTTSIFSAQTILLNANHAAAGLLFPIESISHTLASNNNTSRTLSIGSSGIELPNAESSGGNATIGTGNPISLSLTAPQTWFVGTNRVLTIGNGITGAFDFTKTGAGTLQLNGSSTFTGNFTHTAGLLSLNNAGALGSASGTFTITGGSIQNASTTTALTLNSAKPIVLAGDFTYLIPNNNGVTNGFLTFGAGPVTLAPTSGNNITVTSASGVISFPGPVSGDGKGIIKSGAGTLALLGDNTYTGLTELLTSSNLRIGGPGSIANTNVFMNGGLIELGGPVVENNTFVLGTAPGEVRFKSGATTTGTSAHGGFGSASGYRKVSLTSEGVPNAPLVWGVTPHFMSEPAWGGSNGIFLLSTPSSLGTIELTNDLDFGGRDRRFSIRDGSPPNMPDAVLSGKLTNGSLSTQGGGTLSITNPNNELTGITRLTGGHLRVPQIAGYLGTSRVIVESGTLELSKNSVVQLGEGEGQVQFTGSGGFSIYDGGGEFSIGGENELLVWGTNGFGEVGNFTLGSVSTDGITYLTNPIDLGDTIRNINVGNGGGYVDAALTGVLSGTGGIHLAGGGGVLQLANAGNTYTGPTQVTSGAIAVDDFAKLGLSDDSPGNLIFSGGGFRHNGSEDSTNRLFEVRSNVTINPVGSGPILFANTGTNAFTSNAASATTRTISLSGYAPGNNEVRSGLTDSTVAGNNLTALSKLGCALWTVSGNNTYTGTTNVVGGEMIIDYSQGRTPFGGGGRLLLSNSTVIYKAKPTGSTNINISELRLGDGPQGLGNNLILDAPEGSDGIKINLTRLGANTSTGNSLLSNLIDLSSNPGNSITVSELPSNQGYSLRNGVIVANADSNGVGGRSNLVVRDSTGYGFATFSGPLPANLTRLTTADTTLLNASDADNTAHYHLRHEDLEPGSGDQEGWRKLTRSSALVYSTISIDSTGGPVHLDLANNAYGNGTGNNGRGILITGDHDVKFTGTGTTAYSPFLYHYGTGKFDFNIPTPNGFSVIAGGTGLYEYSGALGGTDARFYLMNCVFRITGSADYASLTAAGAGIWMGADAILEIGGDLNGSADGDFSNGVGGGAGQVRLAGGSGISAYGGHRVVNFGGDGAQLNWGAGYFVTSSGNSDSDVMLRLSSPTSDSTIEIVNPISLNGRHRVIHVADGSADVDAILSGEISGLTVGVIKRGPGTLVLDGENTYNGQTAAEEGTLRLTKATLDDKSPVRINPSAGAKLDLAHGQTDTVAELYVDGVKMPDGIYGASNLPNAISGSGKLNVGGAPVEGTPYDEWVSANNLPEDKDGPEDDADGDGIRNLLEYAVGSDPMQSSPAVLTKASGNTGAVLFNRAADRSDITSYVEASTDLAPDSWTVIATSTAGAPFVSNDGGVVVTDSANPSGNSAVSVTDNRAPIPAKRFYRLRVQK